MTVRHVKISPLVDRTTKWYEDGVASSLMVFDGISWRGPPIGSIIITEGARTDILPEPALPHKISRLQILCKNSKDSTLH